MLKIRGSQVIHNVLFADEPQQATLIPITRTAGRDAELNESRNECLVDRFFYVSHRTKKWYNEVIAEVAPQFFLSPFYTGKLLQNNRSMLSRLRKEWKDESHEKMQKHFAKKWPHLTWN